MKRLYANPDLCTGCRICSMVCSINKLGQSNYRSSGITILRDPFERYEMQFVCRHCDEPLCVDACMVGTLKKDYGSGLVDHDLDRCVGCWMCIMVCPWGAISRYRSEKKAIKCDLCPGEEVPLCVRACPTGALAYEEAVA